VLLNSFLLLLVHPIAFLASQISLITLHVISYSTVVASQISHLTLNALLLSAAYPATVIPPGELIAFKDVPILSNNRYINELPCMERSDCNNEGKLCHLSDRFDRCANCSCTDELEHRICSFCDECDFKGDVSQARGELISSSSIWPFGSHQRGLSTNVSVAAITLIQILLCLALVLHGSKGLLINTLTTSYMFKYMNVYHTCSFRERCVCCKIWALTEVNERIFFRFVYVIAYSLIFIKVSKFICFLWYNESYS